MTAPKFFATPSRFQQWLAANAATSAELIVGFHKVGSGRPSVGWSEAVDEAICVGWIDGVQKRSDTHAYQIHFTPRRPTSIWGAINIAKFIGSKRGPNAAGRRQGLCASHRCEVGRLRV